MGRSWETYTVRMLKKMNRAKKEKIYRICEKCVAAQSAGPRERAREKKVCREIANKKYKFAEFSTIRLQYFNALSFTHSHSLLSALFFTLS